MIRVTFFFFFFFETSTSSPASYKIYEGWNELGTYRHVYMSSRKHMPNQSYLEFLISINLHFDYQECKQKTTDQ